MRSGHLMLSMLLVAVASSAQAQKNNPKLGDLRLDLSVPSVPAFTSLDVQPSSVSKPGTVRELVVALSNGVTRDGELQSGLALEVSPMKLATNGQEAGTLSAVATALTPIQLSLATNAVVTEGNTSNQLAFGGRYTIGRYDPARDLKLAECLVSFLNPIQLKVGDEIPEPSEPREQSDAGLDTCRKIHRSANLANRGFEIAGAYSWAAVNDPRVSALRPLKASVWGSFSLPYNSFTAPTAADSEAYRKLIQELSSTTSTKSQELEGAWGGDLTVFLRYDRNHSRDAAPATNDLFGALRLSYTSDSRGIFLEAGARQKDLGEATDQGKLEAPIGIGGDIRLSNGTWLGLFFGGDARTGNLFVLSNLQWAVGEKRFFE